MEEQPDIRLPEDAGPHASSNIEWWYAFTFLNSSRGSRYALMTSFFQVGESACSKGHYLIYTLIDLDNKKQKNQSRIDNKLKRNMMFLYLPFYLLLHPFDTTMWRLYKSLIAGRIPRPHGLLRKAVIKQNPLRLMYGKNSMTFEKEKEDFHLLLSEDGITADLHFQPRKPHALIGTDGKPDDLYYYSFTQNKVSGKLHTHKGIESVSGEGWFDHQWGKDYSLVKGTGWNWFGLQLDDGRELLLNEMRSNDGETSSQMANVIEKDGTVRFTRNISFHPLKYWKSVKTNARYPIAWQITIPEFNIEIQTVPFFSNQEMLVLGPLQGIWEGAVSLTGKERLSNGAVNHLTGEGFMELVGYAFSS
ncbi:Hydroxyneurosporene synthase (CrtC) [Thalassobacillus cyri]|uniref:Hydroxyneurosporene synthase (CrtC) n=1 Tax=Thalassobacillus cyri TaxID=571932 RepID=A0A1H3XYI1_9BACI|nr:lipocalin family protein [Thalassobacillus cyri]SEA04363.1 Hydroxyneurosporene synthase (CrtC) [Thalassobacillus cyri]